MAERAETTCRLYLVSPPGPGVPGSGRSLAEFGADLSAALNAGDVACVLLRVGDLDEDGVRAAADALRPLVQDRDVAFLLENDVEAAAETGCDGVHLSDPEGYEHARRRLGPEAIVGVACGASRHAAMVAAERGADYVAFGALDPEPAPPEPALLAWWQELMTVPCVALGASDPDMCSDLARAGADFVAVATYAWAHPQGPAAAVSALEAALEEAASQGRGR